MTFRRIFNIASVSLVLIVPAIHLSGQSYQTSPQGPIEVNNPPYYNNRQYVDPNYYYYSGEQGYYNAIENPNVGSGAGMINDNDALYNSYLQSNPPIPPP
jgi:hypothetical protein